MSTFCTPDDVAACLGRDLTAVEASTTVPALCEIATTAIADAVGRDDAWAAGLTSFPGILRNVAIALVTRSLPDPEAPSSSVQSTSETLGAYSYTTRYHDAAGGSADGSSGGMVLSDREERMVRRAIYGRNSATSMPRTIVNQLDEYYVDGEIVSGVTE